MAGHAQLKFVMTECSKTQIRLTRHSYLLKLSFPGRISKHTLTPKIGDGGGGVCVCGGGGGCGGGTCFTFGIRSLMMHSTTKMLRYLKSCIFIA